MPSPLITGFEHRVVVGIADMAVTNNPNVILTTYSLGSCLGIAVYDPLARAGGMLHAMLPDSSIDPEKAARLPAMFLDTGFPALLRAMAELKAERRRMRIYVAGGAQIMDSSGFFAIGKRNYKALTEILAREGMRIESEHIGGLVNRTMHMNILTGGVSLKISGHAKDISICKS